MQKAYRELASLGLAVRKDRSGYYVRERDEADRFTRHRFELERLFERVMGAIEQDTDLMPLAVLRYLTFLAETRAREAPECAFVECTPMQAEAHAREIADRLGVPVIALTTTELAGRTSRLPPSVRTVLTSAFHLGEVKAVESLPAVRVHTVPIEVSPQMESERATAPDEIVLLATEGIPASEIAHDAVAGRGRHRVALPRSSSEEIAVRELGREAHADLTTACCVRSTRSSRIGSSWRRGWRRHARGRDQRRELRPSSRSREPTSHIVVIAAL